MAPLVKLAIAGAAIWWLSQPKDPKVSVGISVTSDPGNKTKGAGTTAVGWSGSQDDLSDSWTGDHSDNSNGTTGDSGNSDSGLVTSPSQVDPTLGE